MLSCSQLIILLVKVLFFYIGCPHCSSTVSCNLISPILQFDPLPSPNYFMGLNRNFSNISKNSSKDSFIMDNTISKKHFEDL